MNQFYLLGLMLIGLGLLLYDIQALGKIHRQQALIEQQLQRAGDQQEFWFDFIEQVEILNTNFSEDSLNRVIQHPAVTRASLPKTNTTLQREPQFQLLKDLIQQRDQLLNNAPVNNPSHQSDQLMTWTENLTTTTLNINAADNALTQRLVKSLGSQLKWGLTINAAIFLSLGILIFIIFKRQQQSVLANSIEANRELEQQHNELISSKQVLLSLMEDIRLEKESALALSEQLQNANQKLSSKNQEMEQFIYTVSHDLRSPLVTISGFTARLMEKLASQLDESSLHKLERIKFNVDHMGQLLNDLLQLSRVIKMDFDRSWVDVTQVINHQMATLESEIHQSNAEITIVDSLPKVYCNPSMLAQCINNLLSNAIKYRSPDRPLKIEIFSSESHQATRLNVKDNGLGIDFKYFDQIFRIFERLEVGEGTGVGLTIVKSIMEKHQGEVVLHSEPDMGSTFTLVFPNNTASNIATNTATNIATNSATSSPSTPS